MEKCIVSAWHSLRCGVDWENMSVVTEVQPGRYINTKSKTTCSLSDLFFVCLWIASDSSCPTFALCNLIADCLFNFVFKSVDLSKISSLVTCTIRILSLRRFGVWGCCLPDDLCVTGHKVSFTGYLKLRISEILITAELVLKIKRNAKSFHE